MNPTRLHALGRYLQAMRYAFAARSVAEIKEARRRAPRDSSLIDLFGWGRAVPKSKVPGRLHDLMYTSGVMGHGEGGMIYSRVRAATLDDMVLFHTSGPEAQRDAVFLGPDTQRFLDHLQSRLAGTRQLKRIVEIGCGNGAAAIWLARRFPSAQVIGSDVNQNALMLAKVNCELAGLANLSLRRSDILAAIEGKFDLIACNPPFVADDQDRTYRNGGGSYGMELPARIVRESVARLAPGGRLLMYTASPIVKGVPVLTQLLRGIAHDLEKVGEGDFEYMKDLDAYKDVDAIETAVLTVSAPG